MTTETANATAPSPRSNGRYTRLWLFGLLIVAAIAAGAALVVNQKLEGLRLSIEETARSKTGLDTRFHSVAVNGLRGIRMDQVVLSFTTELGPKARIEVPEILVDIDLVDLLYGSVHIERIQADNATLYFERPPGSRWIPSNDIPFTGSLAARSAFRLTGKNCKVTIANVVGDTALSLGDFAFDLSRLPDSDDIHGRVSGNLSGDQAKRVDVMLLYTSRESFYVQAQSAAIGADDVNVFLPSSGQFVTSGTAGPVISVAAFPGAPIDLHLRAQFEDLTVRDQPAFLGPSKGEVLVAAQYDLDTSTLSFVSAHADTEQIEGQLRGSILLQDPHPALDLHLIASQLPLVPLIELATGDRLDEYGALSLVLQESSTVSLALTGTTEHPLFVAEADLAGGALSFAPQAGSPYPELNLTLGASKVSWDSETANAQGRLTVTDGNVHHPATGVSVSKLSGILALAGQDLTTDPINFELTGQPIVAAASFNLAEKRGAFRLNGTLTHIEDTLLATAFKDTDLAGSANVSADGEFSEGVYRVVANIDATQSAIQHDWWFAKPAGIGAKGQVKASSGLRSDIALEASVEVAASNLAAKLLIKRKDGRYRLQELEATAERLDIVSVGQCLRLPYQVSGGNITDARYRWDRSAEDPTRWSAVAACNADELRFQAKGAEIPIQLKGIELEATMAGPVEPVGQLRLSAQSASMPPLGTTWFVPIDLSDPIFKRFPPPGRSWKYDLAAAELDLPPWKGSHFAGQAYTSPEASGLSGYQADIGEGHIEGTYHSLKADNSYTMYLKWGDVPTAYFLEHIKLPPVLSGNIEGELSYSIDRDDPSTRQGAGSFEIDDGKFSADYLISRIEGEVKNETALLPPSLRFSRLAADIEFSSDLVRTPSLVLDSEGLDITGHGEFIIDGDMNYDVELSVTPEAAESIPVLRDNFNVQGHKVSQQNIEIPLHVAGPLFRPQGQVTGLPPVGVTLASGALEITTEVIDLPRKILVDLLKVGGGIVGATR